MVEREREFGGGGVCLCVRQFRKRFTIFLGVKCFTKVITMLFSQHKTFSGLTKVFEFCSGDRFGFDY